ncbi:MAG: LPS export ABC transporter periplasmic protein LptC [Rhodothermales bacterium]|nr:LPS export ABC transporter periplasmic protein LptC [Rhodothermales bacterium]
MLERTEHTMASLRGSAILAAVLFATLSGCERRSPEMTAPREADLAEQPAHESWGTEFYVSEEAVPLVVITAPYTRQYDYKDSTLTVLSATEAERVVATVFDDDGRKSSTVTADEIRYVEQSRRFEAYGAVVVLAESGKRLETEHLNWDEESDMIRAPGFARIYTPDENIQGYELEATENLSSYSLASVTGQVYVDE